MKRLIFLIELSVLEYPLDDGNEKEMEKKSLAVDPWGFCGTHGQKRSNYQSKLLKK